MDIKAENLGYRELDRLCKMILNLIDNSYFNAFVGTADEIVFSYDLHYDSPYVDDGNYRYYEGDFD